MPAQDPGPLLAQQGFHPVPIPTGVKYPKVKGWQDLRLSAQDWQDKYAGLGVGVLCGVGAMPLCALDVDCLDAPAALEFEDWCSDNLGVAPVRIGRAPKRLLVYRAAAAGWAKRSSALMVDASGERAQLEALGKGQQFVAYGQHPGTKQPYTWTDWSGGLTFFGDASLTTVTLAQLDEAVAAFERIVQSHGGCHTHSSTAFALGGDANDATGLLGLGPAPAKAGMSLAAAQKLLADEFRTGDYRQWLRVGMALHHEFDASDAALQVWDTWSEALPNYKGLADLRRRWRGFGQKNSSQLVTLALLQREVQRLPLTEFGMSDRLAQAANGRLRYVPELALWYLQRAAVWEAVAPEFIERLARRTIDKLPGEAVRAKAQGAEDWATEVYKYAHKAQTTGMAAAMLKAAKSHEDVTLEAKHLDPDMRYLAVQNGLLDTHTGALLPPNREVYTRVTSVPYDPHARSELFDQTLSDCFYGDPELIAFTQRLMGYALLGGSKGSEQVMLIPHGAGSNGKSSIFEAVKNALGTHGVQCANSTFLDDGRGTSAGAARPDLLKLRASRLVYVDELPEGASLREELVKSMTGGEKITARALYSSTLVEFEPTWLTIMPTNHRPVIKGRDRGIWRRILLLPFERDFTNDPLIVRDRHRKDKLQTPAEAAGILRWCVDGALRYLKDGLDPPAKVRAATEQYRDDMNPLGDWLAECCENAPSYKARTLHLWQSWEQYAKARGVLKYCDGQKKLTARLKAEGFASALDGDGRSVLKGLRLNDSQAAQFNDPPFDGIV